MNAQCLKFNKKGLIWPIRKILTLAEISFHSRIFGMKIQMRYFGLILKTLLSSEVTQKKPQGLMIIREMVTGLCASAYTKEPY